MCIAFDNLGDLVKTKTGKGERSPPSTFVLPRVQPPRLPKSRNGVSLDPTGRCVPHSGHFCPSGLRTLVRSGDNDLRKQSLCSCCGPVRWG